MATTPKIAKVAGKVLESGKATKGQAVKLAASALSDAKSASKTCKKKK